MSHLKSRIRLTPAREVRDATPAEMRDGVLWSLRRLLRLRRDHARELNAKALALLDKSIHARHMACRDLGLSTEAAQVIADVQRLADVPAFIRRGK